MNFNNTIDFLKEWGRFCKSYTNCITCPIYRLTYEHGEYISCERTAMNYPLQVITIVETWSKEHLLKTRKDELLKLFPKARLRDDGIPKLCPRIIDDDESFLYRCSRGSCDDCKKLYWLEEVKYND